MAEVKVSSILGKVVGHDKSVQQLAFALEQNRLPSTMLFVGPSGVGKKKIALGLAQALVCQEEELACGTCASCLRITREQSESLLMIRPQGTQIKIDQAKSVISFLSMANVTQARVIIIEDAHLLNVQAANSLLKILEEPPENSYFILLTSSIGGVLPTIRSRSQIFRFGVVSISDIQKVSSAEDWAYKACQGRFDLLQQIQEDGSIHLRRRGVDLLTQVLRSGSFQVKESLVELVKDRESAFFLLNFWRQILRDVRVCQSGIEDFINMDLRDFIYEMAQLKVDVIDDAYLAIEQLEKDFLGNLDRGLAVENFFYQFQGKGREWTI